MWLLDVMQMRRVGTAGGAACLQAPTAAGSAHPPGQPTSSLLCPSCCAPADKAEKAEKKSKKEDDEDEWEGADDDGLNPQQASAGFWRRRRSRVQRWHGWRRWIKPSAMFALQHGMEARRLQLRTCRQQLQLQPGLLCSRSPTLT